MPHASMVGLGLSYWVAVEAVEPIFWQVVRGTKLEQWDPPEVVPETALALVIQGSR